MSELIDNIQNALYNWSADENTNKIEPNVIVVGFMDYRELAEKAYNSPMMGSRLDEKGRLKYGGFTIMESRYLEQGDFQLGYMVDVPKPRLKQKTLFEIADEMINPDKNIITEILGKDKTNDETKND